MHELLLAILSLVVLNLLLLATVLAVAAASLFDNWRVIHVVAKAGRKDMTAAVTQSTDAEVRQHAGRVQKV